MPKVTTMDGQVWGYGLTGPHDGQFAIMHHGLVGDRRIDDAWCRLIDEAGFRFLTIERPGYGETPPRSMLQIAEWPDLLAPLLEAVGAPDRFDVVGVSAGAPYAYALAARFPHRVRQVAVLSGVPFVNLPEVLACYEPSHQETYASYGVQSDDEIKQLFTVFCEDLRNRPEDELGIADALAAIMGYGCAGPAREAKLQASDWGFNQSSIQCPVHIWHSNGDDVVPFAAVERSATGLSNATLHIEPTSSHFSSLESIREMLAVLKESTSGRTVRSTAVDPR